MVMVMMVVVVKVLLLRKLAWLSPRDQFGTSSSLRAVCAARPIQAGPAVLTRCSISAARPRQSRPTAVCSARRCQNCAATGLAALRQCANSRASWRPKKPSARNGAKAAAQQRLQLARRSQAALCSCGHEVGNQRRFSWFHE